MAAGVCGNSTVRNLGMNGVRTKANLHSACCLSACCFGWLGMVVGLWLLSPPESGRRAAGFWLLSFPVRAAVHCEGLADCSCQPPLMQAAVAPTSFRPEPRDRRYCDQQGLTPPFFSRVVTGVNGSRADAGVRLGRGVNGYVRDRAAVW